MTGEEFNVIASNIIALITHILNYRNKIVSNDLQTQIPKIEREQFIFPQSLRSPTECGIYNDEPLSWKEQNEQVKRENVNWRN